MKIFSVCFMLVTLASCTLEPVSPWDRNVLARDDMQLFTNAINDGFDDHIYFSKEASTGGKGIGGGGCGCN